MYTQPNGIHYILSTELREYSAVKVINPTEMLMYRSEEMRTYLKHKHRGGQNAQNGVLYEDFYATFQIVSYLAKYKDSLDTVSFQTQLEDTFVDDLLIARPDKNIYHQLKNTKSVSWGDVEKQNTIANDFLMQIGDCLQREESFALKLVHSSPQKDLNNKIPGKIKQYSSAEYFDFQKDFNNLVLSCAAFKGVLRMILRDGENETDDRLANAASMFLGLWKEIDNTQRITLMDIIIKAKRKSIEVVNLIFYPDVKISKVCKDVLDAIEGFEYEIKGNLLCWKKGFMNGSSTLTENLQKKIVEKHPKDFIALLKLL